MYLENLVVDAVDPRRVGRFWESAVGGEQLTDEPEGYETRLAVEDGPELDLCFQRVPDHASAAPSRLHLGLVAGSDPDRTVERLLAMGARPLGDDEDGLLLADPEDHPFHVLTRSTDDAGTGPIATITLDSADPDRDTDFWSWLSGWTPEPGFGTRRLRHPSGRGPVLELRLEQGPKGGAKNPRHLDIRLEPGDDADATAAGIAERGGRELHLGYGDLPWRHFADPSGNELCVLRAPRAP